MHGYRLITTALLWLGGVFATQSALAASPATPPVPADDPLMTHWVSQVGQTMQARLRSMAASGEPRQLYLAGLLWIDAEDEAVSAADGGYAPIQRAWLQRALDARPRDRLVARMEAVGCAPGLRCDPGAARAFLEQTDAGNAAVHLRAYAAAQRRGDQAAAERAWQAAVQSDHFDSGVLELGQALYAVYDGVQWPSLASVSLRERLDAQGFPSTGAGMAAMFVMGTWSAHALPALGDLMRRCNPGATTPALRDECMVVLNNVANDESTLTTAVIGTKGMAALSSGADATRWQARTRELQWLQQQLQRSAPSVDAQVAALDAILTQGEVPALRARLQRQGLAAQPPADWQPGAASSQPR
ncbi:hypothetical protein [Xanthomonas sp. BRIP62415]|uniref:hypothetical protein n=1 Tax=Xanthomonas sp. BRIP62415 TaxID=2182390 RepID=UPI000F8E9701|nr:hypothetical protein [Xanthomonas sp. BRIP62415]